MNRPLQITTERLSFHELSNNDEQCLMGIFCDSKVRLTYMVPPLTTIEEKKELFEKIKLISKSTDRFIYGIYLNNELIGLVNEVDRYDNGIELGYVIHPDKQNQGYATEMLSCMISVIFSLGYSSVRTGAFENNIASIRVMEKSGMKKCDHTETIEYDGTIHNCVFYMKRVDD
jgi:RimJ/RimL family protein N-acetyltransferase